MRSQLVVVASAVVGALAQTYSTGIGKTTHTITDAPAALDWFQKHLPCLKSVFGSQCDDIYCACGQIGRVSLEAPAPAPSNRPTGHGAFAIHTVHTNGSSLRPTGPVSVAQVEAHFTRKFAAAAAGAGYDALLDFNTGVWVGDMDEYLQDFSGQPIVAMEWRDEVNDKTYYSFMVQVPKSMVVLEFMSAQQTLLPADRYKAPYPRFLFKQGETPESVFPDLTERSNTSGKLLLHACRVSHHSSDLERDLHYYRDALLVNVIANEKVGNVQTLAVDFTPYTPEPNYVQLHLVQRIPGNTTGEFGVIDFEKVMNSVHDSAITSDVCGYDAWMDMHYNIVVEQGKPGPVLSELFPKLDSIGLKYHFLQAKPGWHHGDIAYITSPNGISVEIKAPSRGTYVPSAEPGIAFDVGGLCAIGNATACDKPGKPAFVTV